MVYCVVLVLYKQQPPPPPPDTQSVVVTRTTTTTRDDDGVTATTTRHTPVARVVCHSIDARPTNPILPQMRDVVIQRRARVIIDVGGTGGHYAFFAASAGIYVFAFGDDITPSKTLRVNALADVPTYADVMWVHRWTDYEDVIRHCLRHATVPRVVILKQQQVCDDYSVRDYMKHTYGYACHAEENAYTCTAGK